ncbi:MAG: prephenate dehydratase [Firmicutes bacterium]|jgi:prephenate dehydratase|nr:prephenate dehydratase [Bacillota bacterium]
MTTASSKVLGYLGPRGTFSEQAATLYRSHMSMGETTKLQPFRSIVELILAADRGVIDASVVPLENSLEGPVALTLDMLAHEVDLKMAAEIIVSVRHHLLGRRQTGYHEIKTVISHPQALGQCRVFLQKNLPTAELATASSTAEAARIVARGDGTSAAIGNMSAASVYELEVLASDIQDNRDNATRFCVLARTDSPPTGDDKTSIVFSPRANRAGVLYEQLWEFASRGIDLTRIESRPAKRILGEYLFFLDVAGHRTEPAVEAALRAVADDSSFFRLLGSYARWREE